MSDAQEALPNPNAAGHELDPEQRIPIAPEDLARHYEQDDVDVASLVRYGAGIVAGAAIAAGIIYLVLTFWSDRPLPAEVRIAPTDATPPAVSGPGLDAVPEFRLAETLQREQERLTTYGWTDEAAGMARIPIDEAMWLMVQRDPAARDTDAPDFRLHPAFRLDASGGLEPAGNNRFEEAGAGEDANPGNTDDGGEGDGGESGSVVDEDSESPVESSNDSSAPGADDDTGDAEDRIRSDLPSGESDQDDEGGAPGTIDSGEEDAAGEEPGGAQSGGNAAGSGTSGGGDQDDDEAAPGTIGPGEEDAEGEEPGGAQSGN